jgi:hypothetical protein
MYRNARLCSTIQSGVVMIDRRAFLKSLAAACVAASIPFEAAADTMTTAVDWGSGPDQTVMVFYWQDYRDDDNKLDVMRVRGVFRAEEYGLEAVVRDSERVAAVTPGEWGYGGDPEAVARERLVDRFVNIMRKNGATRCVDGGLHPVKVRMISRTELL